MSDGTLRGGFSRGKDYRTLPLLFVLASLPLSCHFCTVPIRLADHWRSFGSEATGHGICASLSFGHQDIKVSHGLPIHWRPWWWASCDTMRSRQSFMRPLFVGCAQQTQTRQRPKKTKASQGLGDPHALSTRRRGEKGTCETVSNLRACLACAHRS